MDICQKVKKQPFSVNYNTYSTGKCLHSKQNKIPQISIYYIRSSTPATTFNTWCTARDVTVTLN
jgi:hypothetical protein